MQVVICSDCLLVLRAGVDGLSFVYEHPFRSTSEVTGALRPDGLFGFTLTTNVLKMELCVSSADKEHWTEVFARLQSIAPPPVYTDYGMVAGPQDIIRMLNDERILRACQENPHPKRVFGDGVRTVEEVEAVMEGVVQSLLAEVEQLFFHVCFEKFLLAHEFRMRAELAVLETDLSLAGKKSHGASLALLGLEVRFLA